MSVTIYHNPRCSKSRDTLALLQARGITPQVVAYLEQAPTPDEIRRLLGLLGLADARALMRKGEAAQAITVPIAGARKLRLLTTDAGDGINSDHTVWAEAKLQ